MGWFSDFVEGATNAVKSVTDSITEVIQNPLNAKNLASLGGNVIAPGFGDKFSSNLNPQAALSTIGTVVAPGAQTVYNNTVPWLKDTVQANAEGTKNFAIGATQTYLSGGFNIPGQNQGVQNVLRDKRLGTATFGLSQDAADWSSSSGKFLSGGRASQAEEEGALRFGAKSAIIGATAGTAAYLGASGSTGAAIYGAGQAAQRGDVAGVVGSIGDVADIDIPDPILNVLPGPQGPTYNLGGIKYQYPDYNTSQIGRDYPLSNETGFLGSQNAPNQAVLAAAGVLLLIIAKKRGMI